MKYNITYSCGHEEELNYWKDNRQNEKNQWLRNYSMPRMLC